MISIIFVEAAMDIVSYLTVLGVFIFILQYSYIYDWHRSYMGLVMNISLMSCALTAIGFSLHDYYPLIGGILILVSWFTFLACLVVRAILLHESSKNINKRN